MPTITYHYLSLHTTWYYGLSYRHEIMT